jgi:hypothetical protein
MREWAAGIKFYVLTLLSEDMQESAPRMLRIL